MGEQSGGYFPEERAGREAGKAMSSLEGELAWAQEALEQLRNAASGRAIPSSFATTVVTPSKCSGPRCSPSRVSVSGPRMRTDVAKPDG